MNATLDRPEYELSPQEAIKDFARPLIDLMDELDPEIDHAARADRIALISANMINSDQLDLASRFCEPYEFSSRNPDGPLETIVRDHIASGLRGNTAVPADDVLYAAAIESCSWGIQVASSKWQNDLGKHLKKIADNQGVDENSDDGHSLGDEIARDYGVASLGVKRIAEEVRNAIIDSYAPITANVRRFRAGLNLETVLDAVEKYDIDALYRNCAEIIDNLRHPQEDKPAATWRDAQAALCFYAPALELAGDTSNAHWVRDEALQAIYRGDKQIMNRAKLYHHAAIAIGDETTDELVAETVHQHLEREGVQFALESRVKSIGSIAEKINLRKSGLYELMPNDLLGYRVIIDDRPGTDKAFSEDQWSLAAERVFSVLLGNPRVKQIGQADYYLGADTKPSGYKAIHGNFVVETDRGLTTMEIQIVTETAHAFNSLEASPVLQKARYGITDLSETLRRRDRYVEARNARIGTDMPKTQDEISFTNSDRTKLYGLMDRMRDIRARARDVMSGLVKPRSLARTAAILDFADSHPLLQTLSEMDVMRDKAKNLEYTLPTTHVEEERFLGLAEKLMPEIANDPRFQQALDIARTLHSRHGRKFAEGNYFENHILPMTLGLIYRISKDVKHHEKIDQLPIICAALLHDFKEDAEKHLKYDPETLERLTLSYLDLISKGGMEDVDDMVEALTKPTDSEIAEQLSAEKDGMIPIIFAKGAAKSPIFKAKVAEGAVIKLVDSGMSEAMLIKFFDRSQNILCDISHLDRMIADPDLFSESDLNDIIDYRDKSRLFFNIIDHEYVKAELAWVIQEIDGKIATVQAVQKAIADMRNK